MNRHAALSKEQMRDLRQCEELLGLIIVAYSEYESSGRYSSLSKCELEKIGIENYLSNVPLDEFLDGMF